jgi:hypothetical protein
MRELSAVVRGPYGQREIEERCRDIKASFEAVVPGSRKRHPPFLLTLLQLYQGLKSPLELLLTHLNPDYQPRRPRSLGNRTVTGRMFSELLATDSMYTLVSQYLSPQEISSVQRCARPTT